ncbi:MAG: PocR ligand-binding domain-containing protein [Candidatus Omnitrophota bacterium]
MFQEDLRLTDLVNPEEWQNTQDSFSEVLEITLRTVSLDGTPLSEMSRPSRLCKDVLPKYSGSKDPCGDCIIRKQNHTKTDTSFKCPFGLEAFSVPIMMIAHRVVAYVIIGPFIPKARRTKAEYAEEAKRMGLDPEEVTDALIEINVFSYNKVYAINKLIRSIFSHMVQNGYHKKRLGEIAPEVVEMDPLFSRYYEEKILNSLLNSCVMALDADSGSVMTVDKATNMLHIKVASKLDEKIVRTTNIRVGEGLAGMAAATAQPIILPKDKDKKGISDKMKRDYIKSSMIMPFNKGNTAEVYGVINLNMVRKETDFSQKDIAVVKELVRMASTALIPLKSVSAKI